MLVIGSGTGEEILRLAKRYSGWRIDGVEPSGEMIKIAVDRTNPYRSQNQIQFFESTLQQHPVTTSYDVALSVLVSHFIPDDGARLEYFQRLYAHLKPGSPLILVDMMKQNDSVGEKFVANNYFWAKTNGMNAEKLRELPARLRALFHPISEDRFKEIIRDAGFTYEGQFAQCLGFCGYLIRKVKT
jgi:tRNA (cmo5U34)-methyltransferase